MNSASLSWIIYFISPILSQDQDMSPNIKEHAIGLGLEQFSSTNYYVQKCSFSVTSGYECSGSETTTNSYKKNGLSLFN